MTPCLIFFQRIIFFLQVNLNSDREILASNQLLLINHEILSAFDLKVRGIFLDISKAFDKVWHDGLVFKLHQNGISGKMIYILEDFLSDRKERVVLNGQC